MTSSLTHTLHDTRSGRGDAALILAPRGLRQFAFGLLALGIPFLLANGSRPHTT